MSLPSRITRLDCSKIITVHGQLGTGLGGISGPVGIPGDTAGVLLHIDRYPGITMAQLAEVASVTPQTMHRIVTALQRRQLIIRNRKSGDRKSFYLSLTPVGKEIFDDAEVLIKAEQDKLLSVKFSKP